MNSPSVYKTFEQGWHNSLVGKSIDHCSRGHSFDSQHLHGHSQLSVTPVPGRSDGLLWPP